VFSHTTLTQPSLLKFDKHNQNTTTFYTELIIQTIDF